MVCDTRQYRGRFKWLYVGAPSWAQNLFCAIILELLRTLFADDDNIYVCLIIKKLKHSYDIDDWAFVFHNIVNHMCQPPFDYSFNFNFYLACNTDWLRMVVVLVKFTLSTYPIGAMFQSRCRYRLESDYCTFDLSRNQSYVWVGKPAHYFLGTD